MYRAAIFSHKSGTLLTLADYGGNLNTGQNRTVLAQAQKKRSSAKLGTQRQSLLTDTQRRTANGSPNGESKGPRKGAISEFARKAAEIGRGIIETAERLERLAQCT